MVSRKAQRTIELYAFDKAVEEEAGKVVIGIDEAGRGPLAGPVVAAAVRLDLSRPIEGVNDSKKVRPPAREELYEQLAAETLAWAVGEASPEEIDRLNILGATHLAMRRALEGIGVEWGLALVDGNLAIRQVPESRQRTLVRGDGRSASIAAASIMAKVTRDRQMAVFHERYPCYAFSTHKGYPTPAHREAIFRHGLCPIHRRSFCGHLGIQASLPL